MPLGLFYDFLVFNEGDNPHSSLAPGAVAVAASVIGDTFGATVIALLNVTSKIRGSAIEQVRYDFVLMRLKGVFSLILHSMPPKNISEPNLLFVCTGGLLLLGSVVPFNHHLGDPYGEKSKDVQFCVPIGPERYVGTFCILEVCSLQFILYLLLSLAFLILNFRVFLPLRSAFDLS